MTVLVDVESPYNGPDEATIRRNIRYARACVRDSLMRGEVPFASHLLYTQPGILDDRIESERAHGIAAGKALMAQCSLTAVYMDLGMSRGMEFGVAEATVAGRAIEYRTLGPSWMDGEDPTREGWR